MKRFALALILISIAIPAFADDVFDFHCFASTIGPNGEAKNITLDRQYAVLNGDTYLAKSVQAFDQQDVANSANVYANLQQTKLSKKITASITEVSVRAKYEDYPAKDANLIATQIKDVNISVQVGKSAVDTYRGYCIQTYSGD